MNESYGSLMMMMNLGLRYDNIPWLGWAGSFHLPPVVLTPWMKGNFEDSVDEICTNWIFWMRGLCQLKTFVREILI